MTVSGLATGASGLTREGSTSFCRALLCSPGGHKRSVRTSPWVLSLSPRPSRQSGPQLEEGAASLADGSRRPPRPPSPPERCPRQGLGSSRQPTPPPRPPATALLLLLKTIETTKLACGWVNISHCYSAWLPRMTKGVVSPFYEPPRFSEANLEKWFLLEVFAGS